jgi:hypothetical protein
MESDRASQAVLELGRAIPALLPTEGSPHPVVDALPASGLDPQSVRFLRHPNILNTHYWLGDENVLGLTPETAAALAIYARDEGSAHLLLVDYPSSRAAAEAKGSFAEKYLAGTSGRAVESEGKGWYAAEYAGSRLAAVLGAESVALAESLLRESLGESQ